MARHRHRSRRPEHPRCPRRCEMDGVEYLEGDFITWPFEPASIDLVAAIASLHYLDEETALTRMAQLLRPGGTLGVVGLARTAFAARPRFRPRRPIRRQGPQADEGLLGDAGTEDLASAPQLRRAAPCLGDRPARPTVPAGGDVALHPHLDQTADLTWSPRRGSTVTRRGSWNSGGRQSVHPSPPRPRLPRQ